MQTGESPYHNRIWVPFINAEDSEPIPAHALMQKAVVDDDPPETADGVTSVESQVVVYCQKYEAGHEDYPLFINGPVEVNPGEPGRCTMALGHPTVVLGEETTGYATPQAGQWDLAAGGIEFEVLGAGPIDGTMMVVRNFGSSPEAGFPFRHYDYTTETVPAYAVVIRAKAPSWAGSVDPTINPFWNGWFYQAEALPPATAGDPDAENYVSAMQLCTINVSGEIPAASYPGNFGMSHSAADRPVEALLYDDNGYGQPLDEDCCGPVPGTYTLGRFLPGFRRIGPYSTSPDRAWVTRDIWTSRWWGKAKYDWSEKTEYVEFWPCNRAGTLIWDGVSSPPTGSPLQEILFRGYFPPQLSWRGMEPAIFEGDILSYTLVTNNSSSPFLVDPVLDQPRGTIRWLATAHIPPSHWQVANGTNGTLDLITGNPFIRGNTPNIRQTFGNSGTYYDSVTLAPYQRIK